MSHEEKIPPYRCTSCLQAIPEDQAQHLFGADGLRPRSDETHNFVTEAQTLIGYANVVVIMCIEDRQLEEPLLSRAHMLISELTEEALRRLERAQEALALVWKREQQAKETT